MVPHRGAACLLHARYTRCMRQQASVCISPCCVMLESQEQQSVGCAPMAAHGRMCADAQCLAGNDDHSGALQAPAGVVAEKQPPSSWGRGGLRALQVGAAAVGGGALLAVTGAPPPYARAALVSGMWGSGRSPRRCPVLGAQLDAHHA